MADDKADETVAEENVKLDEHTEGMLDTLSDTDGTLVDNPDTGISIEKPEEDAEASKEPETQETQETGDTEETKEPETEDTTQDTEEPPEETPEESPAEPPEEVKIETEKDEAGVYNEPTAEDPGDFKPGDYSFEVRTTDGKTTKINSPEDAEAFLTTIDDNPELISASQFAQFNRKLAAMDNGLANDKREYDNKKAQYDSEQEAIATRNKTILDINNGMNYLESKGDLLPIPPELNTAEVKWEDHTDNEAIKQRLDILQYMSKENEARISAGLEPTFDAVAVHNAMQLEAIRNQNKDTATQEKTAQQKRGSKVAGKSAFIPDNQPSGTIVGEGGSLNDLTTEFLNQ